MLWGGRDTANKHHGRVGGARSVWATPGLAPLTACAFPVCSAQAPGFSAGELSEAGPGLRALPGSKRLRCMFPGTPQRHRLSWACVLCPPRSEQVRRPGAWRATLPQAGAASYRLPVPAARFPGWQRACLLKSPCVSSGELISGCNSPSGCQPPGSQEDLVSNWEPALFGRGCRLCGEFAPCLPAGAVSRLPRCLRRGMGLSAAG